MQDFRLNSTTNIDGKRGASCNAYTACGRRAGDTLVLIKMPKIASITYNGTWRCSSAPLVGGAHISWCGSLHVIPGYNELSTNRWMREVAKKADNTFYAPHTHNRLVGTLALIFSAPSSQIGVIRSIPIWRRVCASTRPPHEQQQIAGGKK